MAKKSAGLLKGTLDMLILKTLELQPRHGLGVSDSHRADYGRDICRQTGISLFPALHRLEQVGYVAAEWGATEAGRPAKYYRLTPEGRRRLVVERRNWARVVLAVGQVLKAE